MTRTEWLQTAASFEANANKIRKDMKRWPANDPDLERLQLSMTASALACDQWANTARHRAEALRKATHIVV